MGRVDRSHSEALARIEASAEDASRRARDHRNEVDRRVEEIKAEAHARIKRERSELERIVDAKHEHARDLFASRESVAKLEAMVSSVAATLSDVRDMVRDLTDRLNRNPATVTQTNPGSL
ncbi:MAG: hypothetical protein RID93_13060 [Sandaracinaceae bacterium]